MDLTVISIAISAGVAALQALNYFSSNSDKYAKSVEIDDLKEDVLSIHNELDAHLKAISTIQVQNGVSINQHEHTASDIKQILHSLERMLERIQDLR